MFEFWRSSFHSYRNRESSFHRLVGDPCLLMQYSKLDVLLVVDKI